MNAPQNRLATVAFLAACDLTCLIACNFDSLFNADPEWLAFLEESISRHGLPAILNIVSNAVLIASGDIEAEARISGAVQNLKVEP